MVEETELILKEEDNYRKTAFGILKAGRPYVEYIKRSPEDGFAVIEKGDLHTVKSVLLGEKEFEVRREFAMLIEAGILSSPSDTDGRANMDDVYEAVRDWLKGVTVLESEASYSTVAAYVVMTWFPFRYDSLPYLRLIGDYGSGKTTTLRALGLICYRALNLSALFSPAALFRLVDNVQGTLMIDEADLKGSGIEAHIVKILNHGYSRGIALVRLNSYGNPEYFQVFGPKVIATRAEFRDTALESRCLDIRMKQANAKEMDEMDKVDGVDVLRRAELIRNALLFWRLAFSEIKSGESIYAGGSAQASNWYEPRVSQLAKPIFDCTPKLRQNEVTKFFEVVNLGYQEARKNGPEEQVRRIIRKELKNQNHRLTLAQLYGQLSYKCRVQNSSKKIARIAETLGCEKKHTRDGAVLWFREGI